MKLEIGKEILRDYTKATSREWIETNGLGGYSSSTLSGTNTRSYHGMYVVATQPPVGREVLLSRFEEEIITNGQSHYLSCNEFPNHIFKSPLSYLQEFTKDPFPSFIYKIKDIELKKTICFIHDTNTLVITYEILKAEKDFVMELKPYIAYRDFHSVGKENKNINQKAVYHDNVLKILPYQNQLPLYIYVSNCAFRFNPEWNHNFEHAVERSRGHAYSEDLFMHGQFLLSLSEGDKVNITISTELLEEKDSFRLMEDEMIRRNLLHENLPVKDEFSKMLSLAADQFLVKRGELKTIIAGYHWFSDWGRDTMISLPGLCLVNGRFSEAKKILRAFALSLDKGMIPNRFPDESETPEYNTVDATLWYFIAIWKYYQYSNDKVFILHEMLPVMEEIITWHKKGTRYRIKLEEDGLISAGEPGVQLTWMDAKVGDWVVTPRHGKAVEINALWYNAIKIISQFYLLKDDVAKAETHEALAKKISISFLKEFTNEKKGYLYDYTYENKKHDELRPNQIFAISLPFELIDKDLSKSILKKIEEKLLTPFGLRSLSPDDKNYIGVYQGDQLSRDGSYHQGTVWSWLLGPYITAKIKLEGKEGRKEIQTFLKVFEKHFLEAGIGTISEIFDGDFPHYPNGCIAQAWSVAEILRAYIEDVLALGYGVPSVEHETPTIVEDEPL